MRQSTKGMSCVFIFVLLICQAGCAPKIIVPKLVPGTVSEAARMKKIAVLPFEGNYGREFAAELEASLAGIRINDAPFYEVVNRTALDKVVDEQARSHNGMFDTKSAVKLGKLLGAHGLYVGQITTARYHDTAFTQVQTGCSATDEKGRCTAYANYNVNCVKRTATLTVVPKLVDVGTGKICYSDTLTGREESSGCEGGTAPTSGDQMLTGLRASLIRKLRLQVAPHLENVEVRLLTATDDIPSEAAKEKLSQGMSFARASRMNRACEIWAQAQPIAPESIAYLHNLAVCAEMEGKLEKAQSMLREADKKLVKPNDIISASLARVELEIASRKKLQEQMGGNKKQREVDEIKEPTEKSRNFAQHEIAQSAVQNQPEEKPAAVPEEKTTPKKQTHKKKSKKQNQQ